MKFQKKLSPTGLFILILILWAIIKIVQSAFTEISADEAYYAMYARFLDWGYFDHPPMVALFIKLGNFIQGELGTRLLAVVSQIIVLILLWKMTDEQAISRKKVILFFGIAASVVMLQVYGFVMTPDVPLLLFTAFFLFFYKKFLEKESLGNVILLAIAMAGMIYSKYHGILVIAFVILSHPRLLLRPRFYISGAVALLLLLPHIYWQISHDFPSFSYHLVDRSDGFRFFYLVEYWLNQLVVFNPIFFILGLFILLKYKPENLFERALFFISGGFLLFFFLMSFKGHAEPHWTITICLPLILLLYKYCLQNTKLLKLTYRFIFPVIAIIIFLSINLVFNFLPISFGFNGNRQFAKEFSRIAGEKPMVFQNSYQKASLYTYYTDKMAVSLNNVGYRKNQYDIWNFEESLFGKPVALATSPGDSTSCLYLINGKEYWVNQIDSFMPISKIEIAFELPRTTFRQGEVVFLPITLRNPYPFDLNFRHGEFPVSIHAVYAKQKKRWSTKATPIEEIASLKAYETRDMTVSFMINGKDEKNCQFGICLSTPLTYISFNSKFKKIEIIP